MAKSFFNFESARARGAKYREYGMFLISDYKVYYTLTSFCGDTHVQIWTTLSEWYEYKLQFKQWIHNNNNVNNNKKLRTTNTLTKKNVTLSSKTTTTTTLPTMNISNNLSNEFTPSNHARANIEKKQSCG